MAGGMQPGLGMAAEPAVEVEADDPPGATGALGQQVHHRAGATADVEAAGPGWHADPVKQGGRARREPRGLERQALVLCGPGCTAMSWRRRSRDRMS
jgi:hypothetical protein